MMGRPLILKPGFLVPVLLDRLPDRTLSLEQMVLHYELHCTHRLALAQLYGGMTIRLCRNRQQ